MGDNGKHFVIKTVYKAIYISSSTAYDTLVNISGLEFYQKWNHLRF